MNNSGETEPAFTTVAMTILTVIAIAVIFVFIAGISKSEDTNVKSDFAAFGENATVSMSCELWASGFRDNFKCSEVPCTYEVLCKACKHFGKEYNIHEGDYVWIVDTKDCMLADGSTFAKAGNCSSCNNL